MRTTFTLVLLLAASPVLAAPVAPVKYHEDCRMIVDESAPNNSIDSCIDRAEPTKASIGSPYSTGSIPKH